MGSGASCDPSTGECSCTMAGFTLASDGKTCGDINECAPNSGRGPCDQACTNTMGSFYCSCNPGYTKNGYTCTPKDCGSAQVPDCPSDTYQDQFSEACKKIMSHCPSGTSYTRACTLSCPSDYRLARITAQAGRKFAEMYSSADFRSVVSSITCQLDASNTFVEWSSSLKKQFCRRVNDPPTSLHISGNTLLEHAAVGTVIGTITTRDQQTGQSFLYTVVSPSWLFTVQGDDLQSLWQDPKLHGIIPLNNSEIEVTIRATDDGSPQMWLEQAFKVKVLNVNDPPMNITLTKLTVLENVPIGTEVGVLTANDGDDPWGTPASSNFSWELISTSDDHFKIIGSKVVVAKSLDHESRSIHKIVIKCSDFGHPVGITTATFMINVLNKDEPPKQITLNPTSVAEDAGIGARAAGLTALDEEGDTIVFSIAPSDNSTLEKFEIGPTSCRLNGKQSTCAADLMVKGKLDYEARDLYSLTVMANSSTGPVFKSFLISIINVNEVPSDVQLTGSHSVDENAIAGTIIGSFMVTDPDNKVTQTQSHYCSAAAASAQSPGSSFFTVKGGAVLEVKGMPVIDYEKTRQLTIRVTCTDDGTPKLSITKDFVIIVKDVNEAPTSITLTNKSIPENSPTGTLVGTLTCEDPESPNDTCTFAIMGPSGVPFSIGADGKSFLVNGSLDYETEKTIDVVVKATDRGGLYKEEILTVSVSDQNDPPTGINLPGTGGELSFNENSQSGILISIIQLVDQDGDLPRCALTDDAGGRVRVLGTTLVAGSTNSDYEALTPPSLHIVLNCSDGHGQHVSQAFDIAVKDVNEAPTGISLSNKRVRENEANALVGSITVTDPDINQSHRCTVCDVISDSSCTSSTDFVIDDALRLMTSHGLDFESAHARMIKIKCTDEVGSRHTPLSIEKAFTITVVDVNEPPSSFCKSPFEQAISASIGSVVTLLKAVDPDNSDSHGNKKQTLTYQLITEGSNALPFLLQDNKIFKSADILRPANYTVSIKVTDNGRVVRGLSSNGYIYELQQPLSTVFNCSIVISDISLSANISLVPNSVSVLSREGTVIGELRTKTANPGETFTYTLTNGDNLPFAIKDDQVVVRSFRVKDAQFISDKNVYVYLSIRSIGSQSGAMAQGLYVNVINDAPEIKMCLVKKSIAENQPQGGIVGQLLLEYTNPPSPPMFKCSMTSCCHQIGQVKSDTYPYECMVATSQDNNVQQYNASALFYIDSSLVLRTRATLSYDVFSSTAGRVRVPVSCYDDSKPLHFIGETYNVDVLKCNSSGQCPLAPDCARCDHGGTCVDKVNGFSCRCPAGYTGRRCEVDIDDCASQPCQNGGTCKDGVTSFTCACAVGISGALCDRTSSLCGKCPRDTLCVTFIKAAMRCVTDEFQIRILVDGIDLTTEQLRSIEQELAEIIDTAISQSTKSRKRRSSSEYYVEILKSTAIKDESKTLLTTVFMDSLYQPMTSSYACALLAKSRMPCVGQKDCKTLAAINEECPVSPVSGARKGANSSGLSDGGTAGVSVVIIIVIIALLVFAVFYYRRKYKNAKYETVRVMYTSSTNNCASSHDERPVIYNAHDEHMDFQNPVYEQHEVDPEAVETLARERLGKEEFVANNLDPTNVQRHNDIRVCDNALYLPPGEEPAPSSFVTVRNPCYGSSAGAVPKSRKVSNVLNERPKGTSDLKTGKKFPQDAQENRDDYETIDDIKKSISPRGDEEDWDEVERQKRVCLPEGAVGGDEKLDGKKRRDYEKTRSPDARDAPRYEESPLSLKRPTKGTSGVDKTQSPLALVNPTYEMADCSVRKKDPIYDNIVMKDSTGNDDADDVFDIPEVTTPQDEPLYAVIPATGSGKGVRRRGFFRSTSSEKSEGEGGEGGEGNNDSTA
ncbi:protocadherin Fat 4 [Nematostella vectensis]|uniref:protocadherin Fat 4 n=1 Tax=Nematostella vectensis TaxID=45351 RepID=UPI0020772F8E|nr:protocadherin Fat 4 [Nematostella vectensis]